MIKIIKIETVSHTETTLRPVCLILTDNEDTTYTLYKSEVSAVELHEFLNNNNGVYCIDDIFIFFKREVEEGKAKPISFEDAVKLYPNSSLLRPFILSEKRDKKIEEILNGL